MDLKLAQYMGPHGSTIASLTFETFWNWETGDCQLWQFERSGLLMVHFKCLICLSVWPQRKNSYMKMSFWEAWTFFLFMSRFLYGGFPKCGYPHSSILKGFPIVSHPFWGTPISETPIFCTAAFAAETFRSSSFRGFGATTATICGRGRPPQILVFAIPQNSDHGDSSQASGLKIRELAGRFIASTGGWKNPPNFLCCSMCFFVVPFANRIFTCHVWWAYRVLIVFGQMMISRPALLDTLELSPPWTDPQDFFATTSHRVCIVYSRSSHKLVLASW